MECEQAANAKASASPRTVATADADADAGVARPPEIRLQHLEEEDEENWDVRVSEAVRSMGQGGVTPGSHAAGPGPAVGGER